MEAEAEADVAAQAFMPSDSARGFISERGERGRLGGAELTTEELADTSKRGIS